MLLSHLLNLTEMLTFHRFPLYLPLTFGFFKLFLSIFNHPITLISHLFHLFFLNLPLFLDFGAKFQFHRGYLGIVFHFQGIQSGVFLLMELFIELTHSGFTCIFTAFRVVLLYFLQFSDEFSFHRGNTGGETSFILAFQCG